MSDRREAIRARLEAATPGPWTAAPNGHLGGSTVLYKQNGKDWPLPGCFHCGENDAVYEPADADLIAHAPDDIAYLLARLDEAERTVTIDDAEMAAAAVENQRLRAVVDAARAYVNSDLDELTPDGLGSLYADMVVALDELDRGEAVC